MRIAYFPVEMCQCSLNLGILGYILCSWFGVLFHNYIGSMVSIHPPQILVGCIPGVVHGCHSEIEITYLLTNFTTRQTAHKRKKEDLKVKKGKFSTFLSTLKLIDDAHLTS